MNCLDRRVIHHPVGPMLFVINATERAPVLVSKDIKAILMKGVVQSAFSVLTALLIRLVSGTNVQTHVQEYVAQMRSAQLLIMFLVVLALKAIQATHLHNVTEKNHPRKLDHVNHHHVDLIVYAGKMEGWHHVNAFLITSVLRQIVDQSAL